MTRDAIPPIGAVRIGDAERIATADRLAAHAAAGRLTFDELEQRLERVRRPVTAGHPIVPLFIAARCYGPPATRTGRPPRHVTTPS